MSKLLLTQEQLAVVSHDHGPALVFAVAGAGKTTAMVHRIARLVRQSIFAPQRILATSFSRATVQDIQTALQVWEDTRTVKASTLHAVGLQILRLAARRGLLPDLEIHSEDGASSEHRLLRQTLTQARRQKMDLPAHLDEQDFLSYVGVCKGNFAYPLLQQVNLPASAMALVQQAVAPPELEIYLELYALYEAIRLQQRQITFDDMLLSAWECMHQSADLLAEIQGWYDCVLVDEFQDVNAVQSELLDLITARHRNYMVIGDDDQTIYEWRGASPRFILGFPARYQAKKYLLRNNFRSSASHLALANRMIRHNTERENKQLHLTRGFDGQTLVRQPANESQQAQQMVMDVMRACQSGYRFDEQAVLVRLFAQTPFLEQGLIEAGIPYRIVGSVPFYRRQEIRVLLAYLELAQLERLKLVGEGLRLDQQEQLQRHWLLIANRPVRYINRSGMDQVSHQLAQGVSLCAALETLSQQADSKYKAKKIRLLRDSMHDLIDSGLDLPAGETLERLERELEYCKFLRKSSGFPETGEGRARTVEAFLSYAAQLPSCQALEAHLQGLAQAQQHEGDALTLTTIFRAKGLEWPVVYIPHCNQGYIPYSSAHSLEEERRLFYVALTRPQVQLYLYILQDFPISRFLTEAAYEQTLQQVSEIQQVLQRDVKDWQISDMLTLLQSQGGLLLSDYLENWWQVAPRVRQAARQQVSDLAHVAKQHHLLDSLSLSLPDLQRWQADSPATTARLHQALEAYLVKQVQQAVSQASAHLVYESGESVWSERFGSGTILSFDAEHEQGPLLEVAFADGAPRKLLANYAQLQRVELSPSA